MVDRRTEIAVIRLGVVAAGGLVGMLAAGVLCAQHFSRIDGAQARLGYEAGDHGIWFPSLSADRTEIALLSSKTPGNDLLVLEIMSVSDQSIIRTFTFRAEDESNTEVLAVSSWTESIREANLYLEAGSFLPMQDLYWFDVNRREIRTEEFNTDARHIVFDYATSTLTVREEEPWYSHGSLVPIEFGGGEVVWNKQWSTELADDECNWRAIPFRGWFDRGFDAELLEAYLIRVRYLSDGDCWKPDEWLLAYPAQK